MGKKEIMHESSALGMIHHLWAHKQEATGHSWLRMNQGLREGLFLAVKLGLAFNTSDLEEISKRFRGGYWFGSNFESFYTCSVVYRNRSAWKAYEAWASRTPFIWKPATLRESWGGGGQGINNPERLTVGCEFEWQKELVTVTSFNDAKGYLTAQSYKRDEPEECELCGRQTTWSKDTVLHRFKITHGDLHIAKKAARRKVL